MSSKRETNCLMLAGMPVIAYNECTSDSFSGTQHGPVAQLEERIHGMDEVRGSSPLISTILSEVELM